MIIGERLRQLREERNLSQGDIEKGTGLLRCYISRVENGHTVPSVDTLEKFARALEVPIYRLFYDGAKPPKSLGAIVRKADILQEDTPEIMKLRSFLAKMSERDRRLLLHTANGMARQNRNSRP